MQYSRRKFLEFLGVSSLSLAALPLLDSCKTTEIEYLAKINFEALKINELLDDVVLAEGFDYKILASFGDKISDKDTFGTHNDYLAFFPSKENENEGTLWVNHEYFDPVLLQTTGELKTKEMVDLERYVVGGSIVKVRKNDEGKWSIVLNDPLNKRITGATKIPFLWDEEIAGSNVAEGTFQNCSGGVTPWGTILTCEENYDYLYGEVYYDENNVATKEDGYYSWEKYYDNSPEHYGWVVEVNLETGEAQKLVALGRCKHECATVHSLADGRVVVYTGDDESNQFIYKYVSKNPRDLKEGTLYVADTENGKWISLKREDHEVLQKRFKNQTEIQIRLREAAKLVGATPQNRPEDIEIDPLTGDILVSLSNNKEKGDYHGSILKISEETEDKTGTNFTASTYMAGGEAGGFSCPDNLAFDPKGNLWLTTDISGSALGKNQYVNFLSNGLFLIPRSGEKAGQVIQVASAPVAAEFTGPFFHPNGKTLFLSVQHPGETSPDLDNLTSHWPQGRNAIPKSSVITISGKSLEALMM